MVNVKVIQLANRSIRFFICRQFKHEIINRCFLKHLKCAEIVCWIICVFIILQLFFFLITQNSFYCYNHFHLVDSFSCVIVMLDNNKRKWIQTLSVPFSDFIIDLIESSMLCGFALMIQQLCSKLFINLLFRLREFEFEFWVCLCVCDLINSMICHINVLIQTRLMFELLELLIHILSSAHTYYHYN